MLGSTDPALPQPCGFIRNLRISQGTLVLVINIHWLPLLSPPKAQSLYIFCYIFKLCICVQTWQQVSYWTRLFIVSVLFLRYWRSKPGPHTCWSSILLLSCTLHLCLLVCCYLMLLFLFLILVNYFLQYWKLNSQLCMCKANVKHWVLVLALKILRIIPGHLLIFFF